MKNKFILAFLMFFCLGLNNVYAYGDISASVASLKPGETVKVTVGNYSCHDVGDTGYAKITYKDKLFDYVFSDPSNDIIDFDVVRESENTLRLDFNYLKHTCTEQTMSINFRAKSDILDNSEGFFNLELHNKYGNLITGTTVKIRIPSNDASLSSIKVDGFNLSPAFNPEILEYYVEVPSTRVTVKISAVTNDSRATVSYSGGYHHEYSGGYNNLNYGYNDFEFWVKAEDGTKKTYKLRINRPDNRDGDSTLKNIILSEGKLDFDPKIRDYSVTISGPTLDITPIPNSSKAFANFEPIGSIVLNDGESTTRKIIVTAENGNSTTYSIKITRKDTRSDDCTLSNISLSSGKIDFAPNKLFYEVYVESEITTLTAQKNNSKAKLEYLNGTSIKLDYGQTKEVQIKVTSEKGNSFIYTILLTRKDLRSGDNQLKNLSVSKTNIKFNGATSYYAQVDNSISSIEIKANPNDSKAKVEGLGVKTLKEGNNSFIVKVVAENGSIREYVIVINRKTKNNESNKTKLSSDNYLKLLSIENVIFEFEKNILNYDLFVDYKIQKINLQYIPSSEKALVTVSGNMDLEVGLNNINLIVVAENGDIRTYTLNITRRPERLICDNNTESILKLINSESYEDIYIVDSISNAPFNVSAEILTALKNSGKTIIYEISDNNSIIYQIKLIGGEINNTDGFSFEVLFDTTKPKELALSLNSNNYLPIRFKTIGDIPDNIHLNIFTAANKLSSKNKLKLYEFNLETQKLNLINNNISVSDNIIKLNLENLTKEYVLTDNINENNLIEGDSKSFNIIFAIVPTIIIIGIVVGFILFKKRTKLRKFKNNSKNEMIEENNENG